MNRTDRLPAPSSLLPAAIAAAEQAGAMIRAEFHRPGGPRGSGSHAPIDREIEEFLKAALRALHPCSWLGEETDGIAVASDDVWVVDPLDGTADFLRGRRGPALSIALVRSGRPVLGVVHAPAAPDDRGDLIAWADGATLTRNGEPVAARPDAGDGIVALNADCADYALHNHQALLGLRILAMPSPAYRLALAAVGDVVAAVSLTTGLAPWDIAGGHALLLGAGLVLVDRNGRPVDGTDESLDGMIGGRPSIVERIVAAGLGGGHRTPRTAARPRRRIADPERLSRAQGCLLGQLSGDALGSAVEFEHADAIARSRPEGVTRLSDGGTWNLIAGQPTDDSEMALALARSLVEQQVFSASEVGRRYVAWRRSGPFDIGNTTADGIAAIAAGRAARSDSQANGALMRVSPIGIFSAGDPALAARLAAEDARLTHPDPICQAASAAYAAAIAAGVAGAGRETMWMAAHRHAGEGAGADVIRRRLDIAREAAPEDFSHNQGWVLLAFQNAFHWLMRGADLETAVIATVAGGGDTDTNGAICGALLGALQGRDAVPLQWRNAVLTCRSVAGTGVRHARPQDYWPDDALDLAEALLAARAQ